MYAQCQTYLVDLLQQAGIKRPPFTSYKALLLCREPHVGAVLSGKESYSLSGSKRIVENERGVKHKRKKLFDRDLAFDVIIGEYSAAAAESILENFLQFLERGLSINGSYIPINIEEADWVEEADSLLKAKVAIQLKVSFEGGVYRDAPLYRPKAPRLDVQAEKGASNGKTGNN